MILCVDSLPQTIWEVAAQNGFNAILVLLLLYFGRLELKEIRKTIDRRDRDLRKAMDNQTKIVTIAMLELSILQPGIRRQLEGVKQDIEEKDKEDSRDP